MRTSPVSLMLCIAMSLVPWTLASAQPPFPPNDVVPPDGSAIPNARVVSLDPSLDRIISTDEKVYVVKGSNEFGITDGNVWVPDGQSGYLLFSDIVANVIYKWTPATQQLSVYLDKSGYTGAPAKISTEGYLARSGPFNVFDFGSNGIAIDPQGRIVFCAQGDKTVVRLEKDGTRTVLASQYQGKPLNRPNKLAIKTDGTIYFSDMRFPTCPNCGQPLPQALYMIKDGKMRLVADRGHGVTLSPDEKVLYISTNKPSTQGPGGGIIMRYDIRPDDTLANGKVFVDMSGEKAPNGVPGGPDGFAVDREGNVYTGGPGGTWIINPQGKHIGTILLPQSTTNVGFGDPDMKTLYLLDRRNLLKVRVKIAGAPSAIGSGSGAAQ